ncbi:MAG: thiamine phosphate synthase [Bryocella sp.]
MPIPTLYAILDRETLDTRNLRVDDIARELHDAGVTLLQYRDKHNAPQEILRAAAEISAIFADTNATLIMNDRADLAKLAGWNAVHVGQGDLPIAAAKKLVNYVGISTNNGTQVLEADTTDADYIATGPVFTTTTKSDAPSVVGLAGVRRAHSCTSKPLVAIGGITLENASNVLEAGADSVAIISGLFIPGRTVAEVAHDFLHLR